MSNIPEDILINIEETANFIKQNGTSVIGQLAALNKNNPNFSFLFPESPYYALFQQRLEAKVQGSSGNYPHNPPSHFQSDNERRKPPSRWGSVPQYQVSNEPSHYNPPHGPISPQNQQYNNYNISPQSGSPMGYNMPNTSNLSGMNNPSYPNYLNNQQGQPQQGQFFNFNYNQQGPGTSPQKNAPVNMGFTNNQPVAGYPNYSHGNVPSPPTQGMPQINPMGFGNSSSNASSLPSYMSQPPSQNRQFTSNERKSSVDRKDSGSSMETESPKGKGTRQYMNPEEVPVGVMADMLKQQAKRYKERNMTLRPYTPLDPEQTPQVIPPVSKVSESVKTKLELFYKFLNDEREIENLVSKKKTKGFDFDFLLKEKALSDKKKDMADNKKAGIPDYQNIINSEMGVRADGQTIGNVPGGGEQRKGLGSSFEDVYSSFRKQRSHQYHVSAEERASNRDAPELCYVCRMPGHLARDCKFGLT